MTNVDFHSMLVFHMEYNADMTVALRKYEYQMPYGAVDTDGVKIINISEKPITRYLINAGIYLLNPEVCRFIPNGQSYDITNLIKKLIEKGKRVISFPIHEYWMDIGRIDDYQKVQRDYKEGFEK